MGRFVSVVDLTRLNESVKRELPYSAYLSQIAVLKEFIEKNSQMHVAQGSNCRDSNLAELISQTIPNSRN